MERQKFEDEFKQAFEDAELTPADSVWTNVELDLEKASGGKMKRRLLFFQLLAAASMVFAMGVGAVYFLQAPEAQDQQLSTIPSAKEIPESTNQAVGSKPDNTNTPLSSTGEKGSDHYTSKNLLGLDKPIDLGESKAVTTENSLVALTKSGHEELPVQVSSIEQADPAIASDKPLALAFNRPLPPLVKVDQPSLKLPAVESQPEADAGMILLAKLADEEKKLKRETGRKEYTEKMWTSVGVGAGTYNPNVSSSIQPAMRTLGTTSTSNPSAGLSYTVGVSLGTKLSQRLVVQGGIAYLSQNASFTSSAASGTQATLNEFTATTRDAVATSPYKVNSNLQYMSIPVQAGFILVDRKFGVQLNGGVATDLFLQNTLTPENSSLDKVSQGAGSDSPYRTVNFSGLLGTEFSYKVADHYRIAVNPGLRYALNSIYKAEVDTQISPMTFDVSLRFRYIFN